jgi:hypothetical protein
LDQELSPAVLVREFRPSGAAQKDCQSHLASASSQFTFIFYGLAVMTILSICNCADDMFLQEHIGQTSKHDCLVAVNQHAVFNVRAHRTGENNLLQVAAFANEIFDRIAMRDANHILFDDRAIV